jgi:hypothetical protein
VAGASICAPAAVPPAAIACGRGGATPATKAKEENRGEDHPRDSHGRETSNIKTTREAQAQPLIAAKTSET